MPMIPGQHGGVSRFQGRRAVGFRRFSMTTARALGSSWAFAGAAGSIVVWGITGPYYHFSDTWQLIINTATNVITFLMVFLIQNTQNRESSAIHLKLDELIRAVEGARTGLVRLEELDDAELERLEREFDRIKRREDRKGTPPPVV
jgi:low affinity Fe/Cu permease